MKKAPENEGKLQASELSLVYHVLPLKTSTLTTHSKERRTYTEILIAFDC